MRLTALILGAVASVTPLATLAAGDGCHRLWSEQMQLCPTGVFTVIEPSRDVKDVYFVGPIPHPDIWRGVVFALGPALKEGESVRKAVDWHMGRAVRSPALAVDILSRRNLTVDGHPSHLVVRKVSTPNGGSYMTSAILGLQYGQNVAVIEVEEINFDDTALLAKWATNVSSMITEEN